MFFKVNAMGKNTVGKASRFLLQILELQTPFQTILPILSNLRRLKICD